VVTDLAAVRRLADAKEAENLEFRRYLGVHHPPHHALRRIAERVAGQIDCRDCANCCRETLVEVTTEDLDAIAGYIGAPRCDIVPLYTTDAGQALKQTAEGCVFLEGNLCSIYATRPRACREFPWLLTASASLGSRLTSIFRRAALCPIVYNTLEEFKKRMGFVAHHM